MSPSLSFCLRSLFSLIALSFNLFAAAQIIPTGGIVYVTSDGDSDGSSWAQATSDLQGAINTPGVENVFVAVGTYSAPTNGFVLKNNVAVYGGFDPGQNINELTDARILLNEADGAILSGNNDRTVVNNNFSSDNQLMATAVLDGFTITGGKAANGGGIYNNYAAPTLTNLLITGNEATGNGGGVYNDHAGVEIANTVIRGNKAARGGGIYNTGLVMVQMRNVEITANQATGPGGGIFYETTQSALHNVTIANNTPGAIHAEGEDDIIFIFNSIVDGTLTLGSIYTFYSLWIGHTATESTDIDGLGLTPADVFVDPATGNYRLKGGSPAIDAGHSAVFPGLNATTRDLAGNPRLAGNAIDLGAYEVPVGGTGNGGGIQPTNGIVYVKQDATGNGSGWGNPTGNLQGAISAAGVQKVFVATGTYMAPAQGFVLKNNVEVYGGFDPESGITDLSKDRILFNATGGSVLNGGNDRTVVKNNFSNTNLLTATAVLDGFTITGGKAVDGGGIYNNFAAPTLRNLLITGNEATGNGGGVYNSSAYVFITNSIIKGNKAARGGGVYYGEMGTTGLTGVELTANEATEEGGGVFNDKSYVYLRNVTVAGNTPEAVHGKEGQLSFLNSVIHGALTETNVSTNYSMQVGPAPTGAGDIDGSGLTPDDVFINPATGIYRLKYGSPAIDAGANALFPGLDATTKDLWGNPRLAGARIDLGAYESAFEEEDHEAIIPDAAGIVYVKEGADGVGSGWENATGNLQAAINAAGAQKVFVAAGTYTAPAQGFVLKNNVAVYGGFDPDHGVNSLADARILFSDTGGAILSGGNERTVVRNHFSPTNRLTPSALLDGFTITAGKAVDGGGIYNYYAAPTLNNLLIKGNEATGNGGGIYNNSAAAALSNAIVKENKAGRGGGIYFGEIASPMLINVEVTANQASDLGGGVFNNEAYAFLRNTTIADNTPGAVHGVSGSLNLFNSIVDGAITGANVSTYYSLRIGQAAVGSGDISGSGFTSADVFADPSTDDYRLNDASPAIDMGVNSMFPDLDDTTKDLAGNPRLAGDRIDLGAYEFFPDYGILPDADGIVYVRENATGDGSGWNNATGNLQGAVRTPGVQQVWVARGTYYAPGRGFIMRNNLAIYGGFDPENGVDDLTKKRILLSETEGSILHGQDLRTVVNNNFTPVNRLTTTAILDGFTITGGKAANGGGIYNHYAWPTLANLLITGNEATENGGGLYNLDANATLSNSLIKGNKARRGAGIYYEGGSGIWVSTVEISANQATEQGGGIFSGSEYSSLSVGTTTIVGNVPNAVHAGNGFVSFTNSIVYGDISAASLLSSQYSLIEGSSGVAQTDLFRDPAAGDYRLKAASAAIDAGFNYLVTGLDSTTKDLAGNPRLSGLAVDMGAYESFLVPDQNGVVHVRTATAGDGSGSSWDNATQSLIGAIHTRGAKQVWVAQGTYSTPVVSALPVSFILKNNVAVYGGFDPENGIDDLADTRILPDTADLTRGTLLRGNNGSVILSGGGMFGESSIDSSAALDGFVITGGEIFAVENYNSSPTFTNIIIAENNGYGMYNFNHSSPALTSVTISKNNNGGIYNDNNSSPTLIDVEISENNGTGMYNTGYCNPTLIAVKIRSNNHVGILNFDNSSPDLTLVTIEENEKEGIYNWVDSSPTLTAVFILNNKGSGVFNKENSHPVLNGVMVSGNTAEVGGGVYNYRSSPVLTDVFIMGNYAKEYGGGMYNLESNPELNTVTIQGNTTLAENSETVSYGGGICNDSSSPVLNDVTILLNSSVVGGGVLNIRSSPRINNVRITGNTALSHGGGIGNQLSAPILTNVEITLNIAAVSGGGVANFSGDTGNTVKLYNATVGENYPNAFFAEDSIVSYNSIVYGSIEEDKYVAYNSLIEGNTDPANDNLDATDITLEKIFNDITVGDYRLLGASPAINKGKNELYPDLNDNTKDLAGNPRLHDGTIDLGAYEYVGGILPDENGIVYVNERAGGQQDGSSWANATGDLQKAINAAGVRMVFVAVGEYEVPSPHSFVMKNGVAIYGGFDPENRIVGLQDTRILPNQGNGSVLKGKNERPVVFNDFPGNPMTRTAILDGFTITEGYRGTNGGGIYLNYASPTLRNLVIKDNKADNGAGMFISNSSPVITNVIINGNEAANKGGGLISLLSAPVLTGVAITGNTAAVDGGGIFLQDGNGIFNHTTTAGNTPDALRGISASASFSNAIVFGTISGNYTAQYSLIEGNTNTENGNIAAGNLTPEEVFAGPSGGNYGLKDCSPAINAGNPDTTGFHLPSLDLAGQPRVFGDRVDLGAFENVHAAADQGMVISGNTIVRIQHPNGTTAYLDGCNAVAALVTTTGAPGNIEGIATTKVWIENTQPVQYVKRHYEISPENNAETATGTITLYFTNQEFKSFNQQAPAPASLLPDADDPATIEARKANVIVEKRPGEGSTSGLPGSYPGTPVNITPLSVEWNSAAGRWEVSFDVTGFSGFFVKTGSAPLPVRWISFVADLNDQHQAVLEWKVSESGVAHYEVERSRNARDFLTVATVAGKGNGTSRYSVTDPAAVSGMVYYRIRQVDVDGSYSYSRIVSVASPGGMPLRAYPNPAGEKVIVEIGAEYVGTTLKLVNAAGMLLQQVTVKEGTFTIRLDKYMPGIYILYTFDGKAMRLIKE